MCGAVVDGGRAVVDHTDTSRNRAATRAQWALRAPTINTAHPTDLAPRVTSDDDAPNLFESMWAL